MPSPDVPVVPVLVHRYRTSPDGRWVALVPGREPVEAVHETDLDQQVRSHVQAAALAPGEFEVEYRDIEPTVDALSAALTDALGRVERSRAAAEQLAPPPPVEPGTRLLRGSADAQHARAVQLCGEQAVVALTEELRRRSAV